MHYDVVIIGAGMSGLAAGIRLAYFEKSVCILEKHYAFGGLNSYYTLNGHAFDVGLHAVTNYVPEGVRNAPLSKLLRQLRLCRDDFDLQPQRYSEIQFPDRRLRFSNDITLLTEDVATLFPRDVDNFITLLSKIEAYDDLRLDAEYRSARNELKEVLGDPVLTEMLLCPLMYYGSAEEHDMDFTQFVTMFKSIFCQGFARPRGGVRTIIKALVRKFRACGGQLKMRSGVERIEVENNAVRAITLESGETLTADVVLSSAGLHETMRLCSDWEANPETSKVGRVSFVESIAVLDQHPRDLGHEPAIVFFNDAERFRYAVPDDFVDLQSGVVCCPTNYVHHESVKDPMLRVTWLANYERWSRLDDHEYAATKARCHERFVEQAERYVPGFGDHVVMSDMFTPRTIERFTGHGNGAVYGAPGKVRDGVTRLKNLFLCGTDQGFLGIIGAMLSGITIANLHVLSKS